MRPFAAALALLLLASALAGCAERASEPPASDDDGASGGAPPPATAAGEVPPMLAGDYGATIETSMGTFEVELWEDRAPLHVANFLQYAEDGHYDGTVFHRVVEGFVIQGGGFEAPFTGDEGPKPTHGPLPLEATAGHLHEVGTLGAARTSDPDSATSQWFVNTERNTNLDGGYTVFGKVSSGMDVVEAIEGVPVTTKGQFQGVPEEDVVIRNVTVRTPEAPGAAAIVPYAASYGVAPGGEVSLPLLVKNVGGARFSPSLSADAPGNATVEWAHQPGPLSAGWSGVAIARVSVPEGFEGGDVTFRAGEAAATVELVPISPEGPAAGEEHPKASVWYLGLYDHGGVFDTTTTGLEARGFPVASRFQEHPEPLKVWVGAQTADTGGYTPVIPGFASGVVGLREGETRTVRLSPEEGYRDGNWRIFEIRVASVDS